MHTIILEKIPERLLAQYYRWIRENREQESLVKLKDWIAEEAEYRVQAAEIINGIGPDGKTRERMTPSRRSENSAKSFVSSRCGVEPKTQKCKVCGYNHPIWHCDVFKGRPVERRWETAKQLGLCYRCLSKDHIGKACPRHRECKINGCTETRHRLLHAEKAIAQSETQRGHFEGRNTLPAQVADSGTTTANQESSDGTRT